MKKQHSSHTPQRTALKKGLFISLEGIEGTGKTLQSRLLSEYLMKKRHRVILTEEPGGSRIGLRIRDLLLSVENAEMAPLTELLLYNASRAQHIKEVIIPALKTGSIVITDRFSDSTKAYQGYGRGINLTLINSLERMVTKGLKPDVTLLLDLDPEIGLMRNKGINKTDRLELEDIEFHRRVREGYRIIAVQEPERIKLVDASRSLKEIHRKIIGIIMNFIKKEGNTPSTWR